MLSCVGTRLWLLLEQTITMDEQAAKVPARRWRGQCGLAAVDREARVACGWVSVG